MVDGVEAPRSQSQLASAVPQPATLAAILVLDIYKSGQISPSHPVELGNLAEVLRARAAQASGMLGKQETRGDGLLQCFSDALAAAACAMSLRHLLEDPVWRLQGISAQARIALHVGHVLIQKDEFTSGDSHRVACRLESIVDPGAIWTSAAFAEALEQRAPRTALTTRYLGLKSLPKNDGQLECYELIDRSLSTPGRSQTSIPSYQPQDDPLANCQLLLRSNDETDQIAAIQALVAIGSWPAMRLLAECAASRASEPRFRGRCLAALKQIADPELAPLLGRIVDMEDVLSLKRHAIEVFGACADSNGIDKLSELASQRNTVSATREAALLALRHLKDASIGPVLIDALGDEDPDLINAACVAASTRRMTKKLADCLIALAKRENVSDDIQEIALEAFLSGGPDRRYLDDLIRLAEDTNRSSQLRIQAVEALADIGSERALAALQEISDRPSDVMRKVALASTLAVQAKPTPTRIRMRAQQPDSRINEVLLSRVQSNPFSDDHLSDIA